MKLVDIRRAARLIAPLCLALSGSWLSLPLRAQTYHNVSNQKFRTVANGPQSALIVDVPNPNDAAAVRQAAMNQYRASLDAQSPAIQREIALLRRHHLIRPNQQFDYTQAAIIRHNGRLALPTVRHTRSGGPPGTNDITFNFPVSGDGAWSVAKASALNHLANDVLKPELKTLLGPPLWHDANSTNATVTVLNSDPRLGKGDEVIGALLTVNVVNNNVNVEILFPSFSDSQTEFLAMAQSMAQAFHGPFRIGYDAWEQGMARAATVVAAKDLMTAPDGAALDPTNGFYYTPYYDLLNQPPLGNNTFTPPTKSNQAFSPTTLSGMLIPRLQMASTAWLKCYIENPSFFKLFNAAYFDLDNANVKTANDIVALRSIASSVLPNVEGQTFNQWYEQQFVLDTSVTPGPKIYAYAQPTFPSAAQGDDSGAAIFLIYYDTSLTSNGLGDETDLNGTVNPIYWDFNFQNRLFPQSGSDPISIVNGFGAVAPFFTNIGGTPKDQMRVTMDFPVAREYVRVPFPAGQTGTQAAPNDFSGVFVGADSGSLSIQFGNGASQVVPVTQGEFGAKGGPTNAFSRDLFTFTPTGGSSTLQYQRNLLHKSGTAAPIFKFVAPGPTNTLTHVFQAGPQMISLPIKPLSGDLAVALAATPNLDPKTLLLAQYRQDLGADKYQRYPSLPTYQPGYSLWSSFGRNLSATVTGQRTDVEKDISVPLLFGWNQIATPYDTNLNVSTADISFSYLGGDTVGLADAIKNEWVATGVVAFSPTSGYVDITTSVDPALLKNTLEPWKGYWMRVRVTEGITIIYSNPTNRSARALKASRASSAPVREPGAWSVPLAVHDADGHLSSAVFGQSAYGKDTFNPKLDTASPPAFSRAATLAVRFPHSDWDTGVGVGGDFLTDIRHSGTHSEWNVTVSVPHSQQPYTLTWNDTAKAPKGTRLTLIDKTNGSRILMNTASSYAFTPAQNEITRQFQIVAEPRSASHLFIRNLAVDRPLAGPGRAATSAVIRYELSTDAQTTVEIRLGGSIVRHLNASGRAASAGANQIVWDLRDDHGVGLPSGPYTLEITAKSTEGERTRSILPIIITR